MQYRTKARTRRAMDAVFGVLGWLLVLGGFVLRDPWYFATGGLLVLIDTIEESGR